MISIKDMPDIQARHLAAALCGKGGITAFDDNIREQQPAVFANALTAGIARGLFDLDKLESVLDGPGDPVAQAEIYAGGHMLRLADIHHRSGRSPSSVAGEHLARGATVRFRDIERFDHLLGELAAEAAKLYAARVQINVYLTPPAQAGFPPHFDNTDVFILQVEGSKAWSVHPDYTNRVALPDPDTPWNPNEYQPTGEVQSHVLAVGDVLYLPRGEMHSARCTEEESLHLTISLEPLSIADLLMREVRRVAKDKQSLRRRAPWSVASDAMTDQHLAETLRSELAAIADLLDPAASLAEEREALTAIEKRAAAPSALKAAIASVKTTEDKAT